MNSKTTIDRLLEGDDAKALVNSMRGQLFSDPLDRVNRRILDIGGSKGSIRDEHYVSYSKDGRIVSINTEQHICNVSPGEEGLKNGSRWMMGVRVGGWNGGRNLVNVCYIPITITNLRCIMNVLAAMEKVSHYREFMDYLEVQASVARDGHFQEPTNL